MFRGLPYQIAEERAKVLQAGVVCRETQRLLSKFNHERLAPGLGDNCTFPDNHMLRLEQRYVEGARAEISHWVAEIPTSPAAFIKWFEDLARKGPGQNDPIFPWLAKHADLTQMRWFLEQEIAGEAGFDDLVA